MTLPIEIAQLPTLDTVQSTTRLLVQDGVTGTPYQQTTVGKVFLDLVDEIGTGTIVAGDVVISGGTADLDLLIATEGTITDATIIGGTGTFATGSISTLAVAGTLTAGTIAATTINAGTVDISSGKATLATAVVTTGTVGTLTSTTGTIATLNAGTITIGTGTGTLTALNVTGTLDVGVGNVTTANIGTVDISSGTAALQTLTAESATITALSAPTLAVSGTATVGHVSATSVTASGAIVGASGTITTVNAGTVAVAGNVSAATGTITDLASTTLAATGTATIGHAVATSATVGTLVASAGTVTLGKGTITDLAASTLAVSGTATVNTLVGTIATISTLTANAGTVTLGKATLTDAVVTTGTVGTLIANAGTISLAKGTVTDLAATTVTVSGTASAETLVAGASTTQDSTGVNPFQWSVRNEDGEIILGADNDMLFGNNARFKGDITILGNLLTPNASASPGVPEYAYSVANSGAVDDGVEQWYHMTWSSAATTFTAYRYRGACTIGAGSTTLTIEIAKNDGVAFQRGIDEGLSIAIAGAGTAGGDHVSTIVSVVDGTTVVIADAAVTALSASTQNVIWPAFSAAQVDTSIWIGQTRLRSYWVGLTSSTDTTDTYPQKPFLAIVDAYVSPFSLTLDRALIGAATALVKHVVIGTDNSQAIADAGNAMAAQGKSSLWFPGTGIYCAFRWLGGTSEDPSSTNFVAIDNTLGEANEQQSAERDAVWLTGKARLIGFDISGRRTMHRVVPVDAPHPYSPTAGVRGASNLPAFAAEDTPVWMNLGDSIGTYDPSVQNMAQTESTLLENALMMANHNKTITILHRSMGGGTWGELACATNTRGGAVDDIYPWFTNTAVSWLSYATTASPVPDVFDIPQHVINDGSGFHPIHMLSVINRLRALTTREGNAPDIVLHTSPHVVYAMGVPTQNQGIEAMEAYAGFARGMAAKYGYGLIDVEGRAMATQWGFDPTRRWLRRIPSYSHALAPTTPVVIPTRCRATRVRMQLTGADGATVWDAIGTMRIQLSPRPDNYMEISVDNSGYLTTFVQTWGRAVETTTSITNGATTLTTSGQTAITDALAWSVNRSHCVIGSSGTAPLSSGMNGKCLLFPGTDYGSQPQRTFIEKVIGTHVARVDDQGPIRQAAYSATATCYIGGMMFVEHDAHAKSDIIITDGSGNVHKTKITGFTDRNTVTLQDAWPYTTLSSATATIWVGHIAEDTATSTIDAYNDAGANPVLEFSILNNQVLVRYIVGSILNDAAGRPAEPPILFNKVTIRGGGPFLPTVNCTGVGLTVAMSNLWVDDDMLFKPGGTRRLLRGAADTTASSQWGGQASHAAGPWAELVYRPVYDVQNFAAG